VVSLISNNTVSVSASALRSISLTNAPNSLISNCTIVSPSGNGVTLTKSAGTAITGTVITLSGWGSGLSLGTWQSTQVSNVTITGGTYGIYAALNGYTTTLTNVTVTGSNGAVSVRSVRDGPSPAVSC